MEKEAKEKELRELQGKGNDLNDGLRALSDEELDKVAGGVANERPVGTPDLRQGHLGV